MDREDPPAEAPEPPPERDAQVRSDDIFDEQLWHPRALVHAHTFSPDVRWPHARSALWNGQALECQLVHMGKWYRLTIPADRLRDIFAEECAWEGLDRSMAPHEFDRRICAAANAECVRHGSVQINPLTPASHRAAVCRAFDTWTGRWQHVSAILTPDLVPCSACRGGAVPRGDGSQLVASYRIFASGRPQMHRCRDCAEPAAATVAWQRSPVPGYSMSTVMVARDNFLERSDAPPDIHTAVERMRRGIHLLDYPCVACDRGIGGVYLAAVMKAGYYVDARAIEAFYVREILEEQST